MAEPRGTVVGKLIYLITGDESALKTSFEKSRKELKQFGQEMDRIGSRLTTTLTLPIAAAGIAALKFATQLESSQETTQAFTRTMDNLKSASASLVASFLPAIRGILDWVSRAAKSIQGWDEGMKRLVVTLAAVAAAAGPVMKAFGTLSMLITTNPYVALAAAIGTVVVALGGWIAETNRAKRESSDLAAQLKTTTTLIDEQAIALNAERKARAEMLIRQLVPTVIARKQELDQVQALLKAEEERSGAVRNLETAIGRSATTQRKLTAEEIRLRKSYEEASVELKNQQTIYEEADRLEREALQRKKELAETTTDVVIATKEYVEALEELPFLLREQLEFERRLAEQQAKNAEKRIEFAFIQMDDTQQQILRINQEKDAFIQAGIARVDAEQWAQGEIKKLRERAAEEERDRQIQTANTILGSVSSLISAIGGIYSAISSARSAEIDEEYERRRIAIEKNIEDEDQRRVALAELDEEITEKRKKAEREAAKTAKAFAIFDVLLSTAMAIINAFTIKPVALAPWMAALAAATGAAQLAAVAAQPLPSAAEGADFYTHGEQLLKVGDNPGGIEHVQVTPVSSPNVNGPDEVLVRQPLVLQVGTEPIYRGMLEATRRGIALVADRAVVAG